MGKHGIVGIMDRLFRLVATGIVVVLVLIIATMLMMRRHSDSPTAAVSAPVSTPTPAAPPAPPAEDPCAQAVILSLRGHSGVSAQMSVQNMEGQDQSPLDASAEEGRFTTECARLENDDASGDSSPQVLRLCKPGTFVVHIAGSGKGIFDFQAKPLPEAKRPVGPLLLCNYALDSDRVYDWVLKYQAGSKPAVFLLGSKGDPNLGQ